MDDAIRSGRASEIVHQFDQQFPGADHFISYYTGRAGPPTWNSKAGLYGRYVLTLQMPITLGGFGRGKVISHDTPTWHLTEIAEIQRGSNGTVSIQNGPTQASFGLVQWQKLIKSGGDFRTVGVQLETGRPVPGFDEYWKGG